MSLFPYSLSRKWGRISLDDEQISTLREKLSTLNIWPSISAEMLADKIKLHRRLDTIASQNDFRPWMKRLQLGCDLADLKNAVIKRTYSECSEHVFMPRKFTDWQTATLTVGPPQSEWFAQEYVSDLRRYGELRAVIVNGEISYILHTRETTKGWTAKVIDSWPRQQDLKR